MMLNNIICYLSMVNISASLLTFSSARHGSMGCVVKTQLLTEMNMRDVACKVVDAFRYSGTAGWLDEEANMRLCEISKAR